MDQQKDWIKKNGSLWVKKKSGGKYFGPKLHIIRQSNIDCLLEALKMKLKLKYVEHKMQRLESLEKTLMLREIEGYWESLTDYKVARYYRSWHMHELMSRSYQKIMKLGSERVGSHWTNMTISQNLCFINATADLYPFWKGNEEIGLHMSFWGYQKFPRANFAVYRTIKIVKGLSQRHVTRALTQVSMLWPF